jgi:SAM-dependent methyltransferase
VLGPGTGVPLGRFYRTLNGISENRLMRLLDDSSLERSDIVANSRMNRERRAIGVNSYERELRQNPIDLLASRVESTGFASWLDLCCGRGRALIEAAELLRSRGKARFVRLHGVDLVDGFDDIPDGIGCVHFDASALHRWDTIESFDLITCVHGLHYVGDKIRTIERAATWLAADGTYIANLDPANLVHVDGRPLAKQVLKRLRDCGYVFNARKHILSRVGKLTLSLGFEFVGADDTAGPNCTHQDAVNSIYRVR